jgi:hypothetical protein
MPFSGVEGINETSVNVPGRTVILHQDKNDMRAHQFILLDRCPKLKMTK